MPWAPFAAISENWAVIEQAKGVLMAAYGIAADRAFEIVARRSQETEPQTSRAGLTVLWRSRGFAVVARKPQPRRSHIAYGEIGLHHGSD